MAIEVRKSRIEPIVHRKGCPSKGEVEGTAPHPLLEKKNDREEAHARMDVRNSAMVRYDYYIPDLYVVKITK